MAEAHKTNGFGKRLQIKYDIDLEKIAKGRNEQ